MTESKVVTHEQYPDPHHGTYSRTIFGFWLYLMTDFILFATLFAAYGVLFRNTFGGPSAKELFNETYALVGALILLTASLTSGLGGVYTHRRQKGGTVAYFLLTLVLGLIFLGMIGDEFSRLISAGHTWAKSAFLSIYFTVVGTLAVHIIFAILWTIFLLIPVFREGITPISIRRLTCLRMFWQFINVVWVLIFTIVYLNRGL